MFERILVPLDGSPLAESILEWLRPLLRRKDAEVTLARAVDVEKTLARTDTSAALAQARQEADRYLAGLQARLVEQGIRALRLVCEGLPEEALLEAARGFDLIALSTHGRTGLSRFVFGSVAEKILRASPVPVLIARSFEREGEMPFRKILVPTDGSEASRAVLPAAVEAARLFDAELVFLHVESEAPVPVDAYVGTLSEPVEGVRATELRIKGDAASQIVDLCRPHGIDLVAMATHGRSGLDRWVLGSVTEKVIRAAPVPVLVVRS
jgi:nucleotide-binding universal stress UspA family protein